MTPKSNLIRNSRSASRLEPNKFVVRSIVISFVAPIRFTTILVKLTE